MNDRMGAFESFSVARKWNRDNTKDIARDAYKDAYDAYFKVVSVTTEEQRERSFRLRYQVYCIENAFESAIDNPDEKEIDDYDKQSMHSLLLHRSSGVAVGTVRLILPELDGNAAPLPVESICALASMEMFAHRIPPDRTAEVSRFAIAKQFRRRKDRSVGALPATGVVGDAEARGEVPNICVGLMRAIVSMARDSEMSHLYAVMEPTLLRMLRKLGVYFEPMGPLVDYHGRRQPCFCDLDQLLTTTFCKRPDVWAVMTDNGRIWPLDRWGRLKSDGLFQLAEKAS